MVEDDLSETGTAGFIEEANVAFTPLHRQKEPGVKMVKNEELINWTKFQLYEEFNDFGQPVTSTRWVITEK